MENLTVELQPVINSPAHPIFGNVERASLLGRKGCLPVVMVLLSVILFFVGMLFLQRVFDSDTANALGIAVTCAGVFWTLWQVYWSPRARDLMKQQLIVANRHASLVACRESLHRCKMATEQTMAIESVRPRNTQMVVRACRELDCAIQDLMAHVSCDSAPYSQLRDLRDDLHIVNDRLINGPPSYSPIRTIGAASRLIGEMVVLDRPQNTGEDNG